MRRPLALLSQPLVTALPPFEHLSPLRGLRHSILRSADGHRCARCSQVAACPWPEPPAGPRGHTEADALHQRIRGAHTSSHGRAGPAGAALLWIHVHLRDPTSVAHLLHVFAP